MCHTRTHERAHCARAGMCVWRAGGTDMVLLDTGVTTNILQNTNHHQRNQHNTNNACTPRVWQKSFATFMHPRTRTQHLRAHNANIHSFRVATRVCTLHSFMGRRAYFAEYWWQ